MEALLQELTFQNGLVPAVIVDEGGEVLTLCYLDHEALRLTLKAGYVHVFRRSRGRVMKKGQTSGHTQRLLEVRVDCEGNSLLLIVDQKVAGCHTGYNTCYYRRYDNERGSFEVWAERVFDPEDIYG